MSRTQAKLMVTAVEQEAYRQAADVYGVPVAVWAVQVLRRSAGMASMDPPQVDTESIIPSAATLDRQFKIRLTDEENNRTADAAEAGGEFWSFWVRDRLRRAAGVRAG